jgi:hypothetical protein
LKRPGRHPHLQPTEQAEAKEVHPILNLLQVTGKGQR